MLNGSQLIRRLLTAWVREWEVRAREQQTDEGRA